MGRATTKNTGAAATAAPVTKEAVAVPEGFVLVAQKVIDENNGEVAKMNTEIDRLNGVIDDEDTEIRTLKGNVQAMSDECTRRLADLLADKNTEIGNLTADLGTANSEVARLTALTDAQADELKTFVDGTVLTTEEAPEPLSEPFEYNGKRYTFSDRAPQRIKHDGRLWTLNELLTNAEAMQSLIVGGCAFVKQIQ